MRGTDHVLDQLTTGDYDRDDSGRVRKGLAGIGDPRQAPLVRAMLEEINWKISHASTYDPAAKPPGLSLADAYRVAHLTRAQQQAMDLFLDGLSLQQIAGDLEITRSAVQHRLNWARLKFKVMFGSPAAQKPAQ